MDIAFILVKPQRQENVGAAARAINTMGFSQLSIVGESCDHLGDLSRAVAHGSSHILENALIFKTSSEVFEQFDFTVGTTGDARDLRRTAASPMQVSDAIQSRKEQISSVAILFGTEDFGLSNEDLARCDLVSTIPMAKPFPALNLGQSVMVYSYELSRHKEFTCNMRSHEKNLNSPDGYRALRDELLSFSQEIGIGMEHKAYGRMGDFAAQVSAEDSRLIHYIVKRLRRWAGKE